MALDTLTRAHYEDKLAYKEAIEKGVQPVSWNQQEITKVRSIAKEIWQEIAQQSEIGNQYYQVLMKFLESQGMLQ